MSDKDKLNFSIFLDDYLNDTKEGFQEINRALLALEKDPAQVDRLDEVFRTLHTLKSASTMLGFSSIAELAHFSEDFLDRLRKRELPITQEVVDVLFEIIDALEMSVRQRTEGQSEKDQALIITAKIEEFKQKITQIEFHELLIRQGVLILDEWGIIESLNPEVERMFGYRFDEIIGQNVKELISQPYREIYETYFNNYLKTGKAKTLGIGRELKALRKDGSTFPMELAINEMQVGGRRLFIGVLRDITGRKGEKIFLPVIEKTRTIRVSMDLLDSLFDQVGELIITKSRIDNIISDTANKELRTALAAMDRIINGVQENVSAARMVRVDEIFQKFPRMVRDLAREAHKEVELVMEGSEIELDKSVLDALSEPLIHLIRNAISHGIEPIEVRQKQKKERRGVVRLAAKRVENHILIEVEDDGAGIDIPWMKEVAVRKGFVKPEEAKLLEDEEVIDLLFKPGFSSVEEVTDVSGRGVGLDVVMTSVKGLGGTVEVATQKGKGTRFSLKLPLTTAIIQTLMVGVGKHIFAIPSDIVLETLEIGPEDVKEIQNEKVLLLRNEVIPFVKLNNLLNIPQQEDSKDMIALILYRGDKFIGLGVDTVLDQIESIIKPFDPIAQQIKGFSGGTILGDGRVALLLDIPGLLGKER
ncbi:MAG TPA: chemotaxis protein CheA [Candidatus Limnocylindrales bacterium]|nr:chemotaxis protein CheA [Candidatus Limnocylindrales bacterium]